MKFEFRKPYVGEKMEDYMLEFVSQAEKYVNEITKSKENAVEERMQNLETVTSYLQDNDNQFKRQARMVLLALTQYGKLLAKEEKK